MPWVSWELSAIVSTPVQGKTRAASENLGCWLAALRCNDFAGSVFAQRHLTILISDRFLRQCNGLMVYNKIERVLVIIKQIFNYYNTNFSLEITSKVQKVNQKYTFTHKLTTKCNFQTLSLFFSSTVTEWNAQVCGISKVAKYTSMLPSKIDQMKVCHETRSEANFEFRCALMLSYLGMRPPKTFFSVWIQPEFLRLSDWGVLLLDVIRD